MIEFESHALIAPDGSVVGVIEEGGAQLGAANLQRLGPFEPLPQLPGNYLLEHPLATSDALTRLQALSLLGRLRRAGATFVLISHDEPLLEQCADEIWWLRGDAIVARGHPSEVLPLYRAHVAQALRATGAGSVAPLAPTSRNGDGRASLENIELLSNDGQPATVWLSGEPAAIKVTVRFAAPVADPVVGILIRTRIGLNVYGTNTELEQLHPGPLGAGDILTVTFRFQCDLCPGDYTVTAASHDPDGVWHDWQEDAVAFAVADARYTAGVANLRARVHAEVSRPLPFD
ncbi:MAG: Wzt carbohydrate-binding domain-containing protein [Acidobacteriota bacterium]|nr:Wzt carbohydrate-binding domain-containing protein [Acidobacteriota bacterium]